MIYDLHIFICTNERKGSDRLSCGEAHGLELVAEFKKQIKDRKVDLKIRSNRCGCLGICDFGPTIAVYPEGTFYVNVKKEDVKEILDAHLIHHQPLHRLVLKSK